MHSDHGCRSAAFISAPKSDIPESVELHSDHGCRSAAFISAQEADIPESVELHSDHGCRSAAFISAQEADTLDFKALNKITNEDHLKSEKPNLVIEYGACKNIVMKI